MTTTPALPLPLTPTRLTSPWLWLARAAWLLVVGLALALLYQIVQVNYWATFGEWVVQQASPAIRTIMRYGAFVRYLIVLEWLGAGISLAVAFLIAWKRSDDWLALLISATLVLMALMHVSGNVERWRFPSPLAFLNDYAGVFMALCFLGLFLLFFLFPNGRFVPRWSPWLLILGFLAVSGIWLRDTTGSFTEDALWIGSLLVVVVLVTIGVPSQIYRYRRTSDPVQRQQTKWVVFGFSGIFVWLLWGILGMWMGSAWGYVVQIHLNWLAFALIPATIGVSILRYRLWDIDILINRTLVYGALTLAVLLVYGLIVGGLAFVFQTQAEPFMAVLATALAALLALPLHRRLQRAANRLMYGDRDDPLAVLSKLGADLETASAPEELLPTLVRTVAHSLRLPYVAVQSIRDEGTLAQFGAPVDAPIVLPLTNQNEPVGQLIIAPRAPGEAFTPAEDRLLRDIARQSGATIHAVQLTADLRRSRQQLVTAREEERRRLRRDLHDGLGPHLATLSLKLDAARNLLPSDPAQTDRLLAEMKTQTQTAIADIRRLVYDLRPPALDQLGLVAALREYAAPNAASDLTITLEAPSDLVPLPAAVEVAAYRIVTEALTNVLRHAQARHCTVWLCLDDALYLAVDDDGMGLPADLQPGVGFASMRERAEELGGACRIERRAEGGTRVSARLPLR